MIYVKVDELSNFCQIFLMNKKLTQLMFYKIYETFFFYVLFSYYQKSLKSLKKGKKVRTEKILLKILPDQTITTFLKVEVITPRFILY